ncbi:alpha/beta hydrolase family protein [Bacteroidota bacterium]
MTDINKAGFQIKNDIDEYIACDIYYPVEIKKTLPLILISHGFKGWKDWGFFPYVSERISKAGAIVVCFNFSLNGMKEGSDLVSDIDKFANNTISQEIEDLNILIKSFRNFTIPEFQELEKYWNNNIYLLGHSLGGGISLLASKTNPSIKKIAIWSSVAKFDRYSERQKDIWRKNGFIEFTNQKTNQMLKMNLSYLEDVDNNRDLFNLSNTIAGLDTAVLLIHGRQDVTVPLKEAEMLIKADRNNIITTEIIEKTGHTYGIEHPFQGTTPALEKAINKTIEFFRL